MYKFRSIVALFLALPFHVLSQISPAEHSALNYRLIPFSFPASKQQGKYKIEIATGDLTAANDFRKSIILTLDCKSNRQIAEVPYFGKPYTWRFIYTGNNKKRVESQLYHFATRPAPELDTGKMRVRITKNTETYKDGYFFLDAVGALYNMEGKPVWFLPDIESKKVSARDIKLTPQGTITFLANTKAYEIDYNANVLWKGSDNDIDTLTNYHHELTRLANGHYMVLTNDRVWIGLPTPDSEKQYSGAVVRRDNNNKIWQRVEFGGIKEYDSKNNVVWSWSSADYYLHSDIMAHRGSDGIFDVDVHENAFYFDAAAKVVYVSFKNINRVLKIAYPAGNVLNEYGNKYTPEAPDMTNDLFCAQHCCGRTKSGNLFVFNNNDCHPGLPRLIVMKEPKSKNGKLEKVWDFECNVYPKKETLKNAPPMPPGRRTMPGGNLIELPDGSFFCSVSCAFEAVFIVNQAKKVTWCAIPEFFMNEKNTWVPRPAYRASLIKNSTELERLIWNSAAR